MLPVKKWTGKKWTFCFLIKVNNKYQIPSILYQGKRSKDPWKKIQSKTFKPPQVTKERKGYLKTYHGPMRLGPSLHFLQRAVASIEIISSGVILVLQELVWLYDSTLCCSIFLLLKVSPCWILLVETLLRPNPKSFV